MKRRMVDAFSTGRRIAGQLFTSGSASIHAEAAKVYFSNNLFILS
jgi:hypothetical protein